MSQTNDQNFEEIPFKAEIQRVLNILIHSLYQHREIFLRELISNASDALNKIRFETLTNREVSDPDLELFIQLEVNKEANTLTIRDTGVGMGKEELINNIGTIANSGSLAFLEKMKEISSDDENKDLDIIGKFGVGFYSVFMVAKEVRIKTKSYIKDEPAIEWISNGVESYKLKTIDSQQRGTEITIYFKDEVKEFSDEYKIKEIIKKYSDFVTFPIQMLKEKEVKKEEKEGKEAEKKSEIPVEKEYIWDAINRQQALWKRSSSDINEEQYKEFFKHISGEFEDPFHYLHFSVEGATQFRALIYFPKKRNRNLFTAEPDWGVKVYSRNVLIQDKNRDVLPEYFRFIKGVIESEDIPLNVSRETIQATKVLNRVKKALTSKIVGELERLAKDDEGKYKDFWNEFGIFLKEGISSDPQNKDKLLPLLRFYSSKSEEEFISLKKYMDGMKEKEENIYYLVSDSVKTAKTSPHLDYFITNDLEVIFMTEPVDSFLMMNLRDYKDKKFHNIDQAVEEPKKADKDKKDVQDEVPVSLQDLITRFKTVLGDKIADVKTSTRLVNAPCRLVTSGASSDMERVFQYMSQANEQNPMPMSKRILEINKNHEIIQNLESLVLTDDKNEIIDLLINQLFANSALQEGIMEKPVEMISDITKLMEMASKLASGN
ncbi:MAG: Chaperone protein HtpG [Candidatus Heimdallarchaeota archaeon LC_3]|nr:MAG: Chaperone protein HtpG [Candidatus Heimdallarchaeota archaeon LC_3]